MNQQNEKHSKVSKSEFRSKDSRWSQFGPTGFNSFLDQLSHRLVINVETFLVGAISLLLISLALLLDKFPLFMLAILITPIVSPILGLAFGFNLGSLKFLKIGLISLLLNFVSFFIVGGFSGFIARQFPEREFIIWEYFIEFNWSGLLLLFVGILIMVSTIIRNPRQASLVANVALAYSFYLPLVSSGFAFGMGLQTQFLIGMITFLQYFGIAIVFGVGILLAYKIRPVSIKNSWGIMSLIILMAVVGVIFFKPDILQMDKEVILETENMMVIENNSLSQISPILPSPTNTQSISLVEQVKPTETLNLIPTSTATITLTPLPTIIWAEVRSPEGDGANIREEPGFDARIVRTVLNGTAVQILDEIEVIDGATWVHIRFIDQVDGWIMRSLIVSATPEPEW
jgi:hypothetical protein